MLAATDEGVKPADPSLPSLDMVCGQGPAQPAAPTVGRRREAEKRPASMYTHGVSLTILYRDEFLLAVDKPSGLLVHRGWGDDLMTAVDEVRALIGARTVHPVHRLDRGTSGVLVFALDPKSAARLGAQFESGEVDKRYVALVRGVVPERGVIDHAISRREDGPRVPAVTEFARLAEGPHRSLLVARPRTGRLHQVRRHLKHIHHPLVGDANYGRGEINRDYRARFGLARLALHAASCRLQHPATGAPLHLRAPLPDDLTVPLEAMGWTAEAWSPLRIEESPLT